MEPTIIATEHGYEIHVHGNDSTLFAARPEWAHAAILFKDTLSMSPDIPHPDAHEIGGHIYAGNLRSDPFLVPFWFATEEDATKAAETVKDMELVDAVRRVEMLRAVSAKRAQ